VRLLNQHRRKLTTKIQVGTINRLCHCVCRNYSV
jgi:hypothetical protein